MQCVTYIHGIVPSTMSDVDGNTFSSNSISTFIITNVAISSNRSIGGCKVHPNSRIKPTHEEVGFSSDGESLPPFKFFRPSQNTACAF